MDKWYETNEFNFVTLQNPAKYNSDSSNLQGKSKGNRIRNTSSKRGKSIKVTSKHVRSQTKNNKSAKKKKTKAITAADMDASIREEVKHKFGKYGLLPSHANEKKEVSRGRSKSQKPKQTVQKNSRQRGGARVSAKRTSSGAQKKSTQRKSQAREGKSNRKTSSKRKSSQTKPSRGRSVNTVNKRGTSRSKSKTNQKSRNSTKRKTIRMWVRTSSPQNRGERRGTSRSQSNRGNSAPRKIVRGMWVRTSSPKPVAPKTIWTWLLPGYIPRASQNGRRKSASKSSRSQSKGRWMWTLVPPGFNNKTTKKDKKQPLLSNSRSKSKGKVNKKRKADSILEDANLQPLGGTLIKGPVKRIRKNEEDFDTVKEESLKLVTLAALKNHTLPYYKKDDHVSEDAENIVKKKVSGIRKKMNIETQIEVSHSEVKTNLGTTFIDN